MKRLTWSALVVLFLSFHTFSWAQEAKEVKVKTDLGKIYGSLLTTEKKKESPIVIIIPGSGPTDRDGNSVLVQTNNYKLLAEGLLKEGISSLRYDKLMVGKSEATIEEKDLKFEDNVTIVNAWIDYLNAKKFENIILIGHSEGSLIGMLAAQTGKVNKYISIAGTGRTIDKVLIEQLNDQTPSIISEVRMIFKKLKKGKKATNVSPELAGLFRPSVQPYLISWLKFDPKEEIGEVRIPTLIVHGSTDIQVTEEDAHLQYGGSKAAELVIIDGMNHIFKEAPMNKEKNTETYYKPGLPLHPELLPTLVTFIKKSEASKD